MLRSYNKLQPARRKWTHIGPSTARFTHFGYPQWFKWVTGVVEFLAGVGFVLGFWWPQLALPAAALLLVEMLVAAYSHLARGKDAINRDVRSALTVLVLAAIVLVIHLIW